MTLDEFLSREARSPGYPGSCCRMADRWFAMRMGFSALTNFGRDFETDEDVAAWLKERGGIARAVIRVMRAARVSKTFAPKEGDVGLVWFRNRLAMAIFDGRLWATRDERGLAFVSGFVRAWSLA